MHEVDTCYRVNIGDVEDKSSRSSKLGPNKHMVTPPSLYMRQASNASPMYLKQILVQNGTQTYLVQSS